MSELYFLRDSLNSDWMRLLTCSEFRHKLLLVLIVLVLCHLLLLILGLVLLSILDNPLSDGLNGHIRLNVELLIDTHLLCDLVRINASLVFQYLILLCPCVHHLLNVQTLYQVTANLIGSSDNDIIYMSTG